MRPRYSAGILHAHRASSAPSCSPRCLNGNFELQRQRPPLRRPFLGRQSRKLHFEEILQGMYHVYKISWSKVGCWKRSLHPLLWCHWMDRLLAGGLAHASAAVTDAATNEPTASAPATQLRLIFGTKVIPHPDKVGTAHASELGTSCSAQHSTPLWAQWRVVLLILRMCHIQMCAPCITQRLAAASLAIISHECMCAAGVLWWRGCLLCQRCRRWSNGSR